MAKMENLTRDGFDTIITYNNTLVARTHWDFAADFGITYDANGRAIVRADRVDYVLWCLTRSTTENLQNSTANAGGSLADAKHGAESKIAALKAGKQTAGKESTPSDPIAFWRESEIRFELTQNNVPSKIANKLARNAVEAAKYAVEKIDGESVTDKSVAARVAAWESDARATMARKTKPKKSA